MIYAEIEVAWPLDHFAILEPARHEANLIKITTSETTSAAVYLIRSTIFKTQARYHDGIHRA